MRTFFSPSTLAVKIALLSAISAPSILFSSQALGTDSHQPTDDLEVITISNQRYHNVDTINNHAQGYTSVPDLASWLASVPGANINSNGPITGIAQYRGLYGDRVATLLDGHPVIGAGPNAMDTPLSYSTPLIVDSMTVYRGVAPVSAGINTLGGAVEVTMRKAETMAHSALHIHGDLQAGYRSNNAAKTLSAVTNLGQGDFAVLLYANKQTGDSMDSGGGVDISPTNFDKIQLGSDIRYQTANSEIGFAYHYTDTTDSGTPALPMDIEYIDSHRFTLDGAFSLADWQASWQVGYLDADHGMTNYLMRENSELSKYRRNNATAQTGDFNLQLAKTFNFAELVLGTDGYFAVHDSIITNEHNAMFKVVNFNDVEDNRYAIFAELKSQLAHTNVRLGVRLKRAQANAGKVSSSVAMMATMMGTLASDLENDFNNAKRKVADNNVDIALNTQTKLSDKLSFSTGFGLKNRAPSYQERYLWTPMEATSGLADGHTYIGDINLKSERAYQGDLGLNYQDEQWLIAPHVFYQSIDNYIQGTPMGMDVASAKMLATMMSGDDNPLQFANVDAKLYGIDINAYYLINAQLKLSTIISYVQGKRRDIDDNLYRIAPLNGQINLTYSAENWQLNTSLVLADQQDDVSITNGEQSTSGYGIVNIDGQYYLHNDLTLRLGVDNIFDKNYQNHLGGYNRVKGTDIPVMSRLPSEGMSAWAEVTYSF